MKSGRSALIVPFALLLVLFVAGCADTAVAPDRSEVTPPDETENVYIVGEGDVVLNGRLFGSGNEPAVILSHMRPNDQSAWFEFAEELADEGYAALTFNFRGYGDSEGDVDFAMLDEDLSSVIGYLRDRGAATIILVGASMGATTSLVVATREDVAGVVAISPPAEFEDQNALEAVPQVDAPKLFIATEGDAPALRFDELVEAAAEPKASEVYAGNAHGTALFDRVPENEHADAVRERVRAFLREVGGS